MFRRIRRAPFENAIHVFSNVSGNVAKNWFENAPDVLKRSERFQAIFEEKNLEKTLENVEGVLKRILRFRRGRRRISKTPRTFLKRPGRF